MRFLKILILSFFLVFLFIIQAFGLETSAKSAVLINADTFSVLYSKNESERLPMASTTKILTALLLAEENSLQRVVKTTSQMVNVEGSSMGLKVGDTVSLNDLLYGIMLSSGNDAANTAAISISGSIDKFAEKMNRKAQELGLHNSNFVTPSGLDANEHYSSAYDLSVLTAYALRNEIFANAVKLKNKTVAISGKSVTLTNHNKLLNLYPYCIGVKTGFTKRSGRCLVSAAKKENTTLIAVTLNDGNDWQDHIDMFEYGFSIVKDTVVFPKVKNKVPIISNTFEEVEIEFEPLEIGTTGEEITYKINLPSVITAPVSKNQLLGNVDYYANNRLIATKNILAKNEYKNESSGFNFFDRLSRIYLILIRSI